MELWALDTEDDSKGRVYLINFYNGKTHHTFKDPVKARKWLSKQTGRMEIWATNLGYDLANLFQGDYGSMEITYIKGRVIQAKFKSTHVYFRDTLNHWKISVKEMGERIGIKKLDAKGSFNNVRYCRRDTKITHTFVLEMKKTYEGFGAKLKATIGSTALDFFNSRFATKSNRSFFKQSELDWLLGGYYGGRVEIFETRPIRGQISYWDFNSLYPSVMLGNDFPCVRRHSFRLGYREESNGIAEAVVFVPRSIDLPYLPLRSEKGLIFPTGRFRGQWTHFELREAQKYGVRIEKVFRSLEFSNVTRPFDGFVEELYEARLRAQKKGDQLMSDALKLILNNLYGKFAQGNEITMLLPFSESVVKHGDQLLGNMILRNQVQDYPKHTNVIWSAYVTAYGRDKLYRGMLDVKKSGSRLIYCDTDSIILEGVSPFKSSKNLGELKLEGEFSYAEFKLPKLYKLSGEKEYVRAKGVPRNVANDFFEKGFAEFNRPYKLRESLRRKLTPNEWHLERKEVKRVYDKRRVKKDGTTEPIYIG